MKKVRSIAPEQTPCDPEFLEMSNQVRLVSKLPSTDLSTGTVWAFNSPEMILRIAK